MTPAGIHERSAMRALAKAATELRDAADRLDRAAAAAQRGAARDTWNETAKLAGMCGEAVEAIRRRLEGRVVR